MRTKVENIEYGTYSHPEQNSGSFAQYVINHNKGRPADLTTMFYLQGSVWREFMDANSIYGSDVYESGENQSTINVYRIGSGTSTIKFKLTWF